MSMKKMYAGMASAGRGIFLFSATTLVAFAQSGGTDTSEGCAPGKLCNPLKSRTLDEFLLKVIDIILIFALPVIIFFIMYAGYLFVTARGDSGQISEAKTALTWAVIGGVIILGARAIIAVVQGTVNTL